MSVSRETMPELGKLAELVRKWNPAINLVARRDLPRLEERHIEDSVQLAEYGLEARTWCDLGSGGGFPGLVISAMRPSLRVCLIETDQRKAAFLRTAIRELDLNAEVICARAEAAEPQLADVVSARAVAPLARLLGLAVRHGQQGTSYLFPKGERYQSELAQARKSWRFDIDVLPSRTEKDSVILRLENIERV